jgi:hypothetical protein
MSSPSFRVPDLVVSCSPAHAGWVCEVRVGSDPGSTGHHVRVAGETLERFGLVTDADPDGLVRASFAYLLEREPREQILRSFELSEIARYFPEWEAEIRRRLTRP